MRVKLLVAALPLLGLGACAGTQNRSLESVHQPVVSHTDYVFDANTSGGRLAEGEEARLAGWMASLRLGYGDRVAIDDPNQNGYVARDEIAALIARSGLFLADRAPITQQPLVPGAVRVVVTRSTASVPGCPDYSRTNNPNFANHTTSNFGCAANSNLALMVARPDDLVRGQPGAEVADPAVSTKAIQSLRKAPPTGAGGLKSEGSK